MHANLDLILTLTGSLAAALAFGYVAQRARLSPIVGYLLAGIAVGEYTPGFRADRHLAEQLGTVGVVLLMFGVGLQFHFKELLAVRRVAVPGAIVQSLAATALGTVIGWVFGWGWSAGLVYGMAVSVASTVVLVRVLSDRNVLHTPTGHIAVGWLVVEDLITVVVLVLLPALFGEGAGATGLPMAILLTALKITVLIAATFVAGGRIIPWLLGQVAATGSRELFTLTVLVVALGIAVGSARMFGVSMELGAFLAGMVVGRSDFSLRAATDALPMRDAFAVLFFVSTGMLFDPRYLLEAPWLVAGTLGIVMVGKPLAALLIVLLLRYPLRLALSVSVALAQIGEFSFMLASLGRELGVVPEAAMNALVGAAILSISANPFLFVLVTPVEAWIARHPRLSQWLSLPSAALAIPVQGDATRTNPHRVVVVGYGPVGRTLSRLLRESGIEPTVVEMNMETVSRLRREGLIAIYGDAGHSETLRAAGVEKAGGLLLSASDLPHAPEIIRHARKLNPEIRILVRCTYVRDMSVLYQAGANGVVSGEGEVALAMTEAVLRNLGAVPEQIDRERERVRADLFGKSPSDSTEPVPEGAAPPNPVPSIAPEIEQRTAQDDH